MKFNAVPTLADHSGLASPVPFLATGAKSTRAPVGSGGDESGPINAAIAAVPASTPNGGKVYFPPPFFGA